MKTKTGEVALKETYRVEAFSDAVFAISITLLVLELIQVLHIGEGEGLQQLVLNHLDTFLAFAIGFLTILVCWINHHLVFTHMEKADGNLVWVNGFVLLIVSFTPFPTAILAEYFAKEPHMALAIFDFNYVLVSIVAYCITAYVYKKKLIDRNSRELIGRLKLLYKYSIIATFLNIFICMLSVPAAIIFYCILFFIFAFPARSAQIICYRKPKTISSYIGRGHLFIGEA